MFTAPTASTGFAAANQTFGLTFHRTWAIPVPDPRDDTVLQSKLQESARAEVMGNVILRTVDKISSLHIAAFEAAARLEHTSEAPSVGKGIPNCVFHDDRFARDGIDGELFLI